ncbi:MAG: heavy metal translocating P-type ATPase, partial [Verrucomicrobia bacterium]|nr:heavy metal translocating P-type ATPase [Verrucomicrobiota bacterium]
MIATATRARTARIAGAGKPLPVLNLEVIKPNETLTIPKRDIRVLPESGAILISAATLFSKFTVSLLREFLSRIFRVAEISEVEINRKLGFARLKYSDSLDAPSICRELKEVLTSFRRESESGNEEVLKKYQAAAFNVDRLYLDLPVSRTIHVCRIGSTLSTWQVGAVSDDRVRLRHPLLRGRKDVAYRLEEELAAILGVRSFKTNFLKSTVTVRFNPRRLNVERLVRHLEAALPRLVHGLEGPPPSTRFFASTTLITSAFIAQFFVPALIPYTLAGVAIYGCSNVLSAMKLVARRKVGLPVLYTGTLTFTLLSGMPFSASMMALLMQIWPRLAYNTLTRTQRRVFATHRQRATWARLVHQDGLELEVDIDKLAIGDAIAINEGEVIPVDGIIIAGLAAIDQEALTGRAGAFDKAPGDRVYASTFVRHGRIVVRVTRIGIDTVTGYIGAQLVHGKIQRLPSAAEAEDVATRMVVPALAISGLNLVVTGAVLPSQATMRPDYATGPRLSAQLAALYTLSDALRCGILFRDPAAMDRLPATDIFVFDDSTAMTRTRIEVGEVITDTKVGPNFVLSCAASAFPAF